MTRIAISAAMAVATLLLVVQSNAADVGRRPMDPAVNWTGCYVGGNAAYASSRLSETSTYSYTSIYGNYLPTPQPGYGNGGGTAYGGQVGCDYQLRGSSWVVGLGLDGEFLNLKNTRNQSYSFYVWDNGGIRQSTATYSTSQTLDAMASANARVGYAFERLMPFATAGLTMAWGKNINAYRDEWSTSVSTVQTSGVGGFAGVGAAYLVTPNWSVEGQYRHYWLPQTVFGTRQDVDTYTIGVNYRF